MNTGIAVDWLSFTVHIEELHIPVYTPVTWVFVRECQRGGKERTAKIITNRMIGHTLGKGRVPYPDSLVDGTTGLRLFYSTSFSPWLVECPGVACATLAEAREMIPLLEENHRCVTRIDVAVDYLDRDITPGDIVTEAVREGAKTVGHYESQTGETWYLGSMKSERFVRVYMYNPPHPRANVTRVELVYRGKYGPKIAKSLADGLVQEVVNGAYTRLGLESRWLPSAAEPFEPTVSRKGAREAAGRLQWVYGQVVPALQGMFARGELSLDDLIEALDLPRATDVIE